MIVSIPPPPGTQSQTQMPMSPSLPKLTEMSLKIQVKEFNLFSLYPLLQSPLNRLYETLSTCCPLRSYTDGGRLTCKHVMPCARIDTSTLVLTQLPSNNFSSCIKDSPFLEFLAKYRQAYDEPFLRISDLI
jgi:hypothetical protein